MQDESAAVDFGVAAHVHTHFAGVELPIGMRQFASGNGAVIDEVMVLAGFLDKLAGRRQRER